MQDLGRFSYAPRQLALASRSRSRDDRILTYKDISGIRETERRIDVTNEILLTLQTLYSELRSAESGARGYLITGADAYSSLTMRRMSSCRVWCNLYASWFPTIRASSGGSIDSSSSSQKDIEYLSVDRRQTRRNLDRRSAALGLGRWEKDHGRHPRRGCGDGIGRTQTAE